MFDFDVILVGGGLANGLIADRLATTRPELKVMIIEAGDSLGGDHTWSYHATDVSPAQDQWLREFGAAAWKDQEVRFPSYRRPIATGYRTIISSTLHDRLIKHASLAIRLSTRAQNINDNAVELAGGETLTAACVIDGRGLSSMPTLSLGYQKFFGLEVELAEPHGLTSPILMDTTVDQTDGYRFVYCLPYSPTMLLIEDTYYSDSTHLDPEALSKRVHRYASDHGWNINTVLREEKGILPVVLDGTLSMVWPEADKSARSGMRSGLFHQTTGYSLPFAAHTADGLANLQPLTTTSASGFLRKQAETAWDNQSFFRMLNRFLFIAAAGEERRRIFERFYRLPKSLIERFYAADLKSSDKFRILFGNPPVAIHKALCAIPPGAAASRRAETGFGGR